VRVLTVARMTFQEARQRRLFWAVGLMGLALLVVFAVGFHYMHRDVAARAGNKLPEATNVLLMVGLYVVNFLVVMLAVVLSADAISGEVASGTIQTVVTKPLRRWEVLLGKWLGLAGMLAAFTVGMSAAMMGVVGAIARYVVPSPILGVGLMTLEGLLVLTLSVLGGARLSTVVNGIVVFMLYGVAFIGGWIGQMGGLAQNSTAVTVGRVVGLIVPIEALWRRAAYVMQPPLLRDLPVTPFAAVGAPGRGIVLYAAIYMAVALAGAVALFERRDL